MESFDTWLSIIDIIICIVDLTMIIYLSFWKFPHERVSKKPFISRISKRPSKPHF